MIGKPYFGSWLTHQWNIEGKTGSIKGIRLLARFVIGDISFPKVAKTYGSYYQWVLKHAPVEKRMLYTLSLEAAWKMWELLPDTTKQAAIKE